MFNRPSQSGPLPKIWTWASAFSKTSRKRDPKKEKDRNKRHGISIPYLSGVPEKFRKILQKHDIPVQFKPSNTLRQRLVHQKDKTPRQKQSSVVYAIQCQEECNKMYTGETKQPIHKRMAQHRRATSSGQDSAVHLHLKESGERKHCRHRLNCVRFQILASLCAYALSTGRSSAQLHRRDSDSRRWHLFFSNLSLCWSFRSHLSFRLYSFLPSPRCQTQAAYCCIFGVLVWTKRAGKPQKQCVSEHPEVTSPPPKRFILLR